MSQSALADPTWLEIRSPTARPNLQFEKTFPSTPASLVLAVQTLSVETSMALPRALVIQGTSALLQTAGLNVSPMRNVLAIGLVSNTSVQTRVKDLVDTTHSAAQLRILQIAIVSMVLSVTRSTDATPSHRKGSLKFHQILVSHRRVVPVSATLF